MLHFCCTDCVFLWLLHADCCILRSSSAGLYQFLPPESREFEDLVKTVSSCYLDQASRGTFSYCKARLIHNELLEKEVGWSGLDVSCPCMLWSAL